MAEEGISPQSEETETIDTITLNELEANEQLQASDIILTRDEQGRDRKATMLQVKDFSYPPDASASQAGLINTENQSFTGVKTFENGIEAGNITKSGENVLSSPETNQLIEAAKSLLQSNIDAIINDTVKGTGTTYSSNKVDTDFAKKSDIPSLSGYIKVTASDLTTAAKKYVKFSNGMIIQWGKQTESISVTGGDNKDGAAITFGTAFTAEPTVIMIAIGGNQMNMTAPTVSKTGFTPKYRNVNTNTTGTAMGCYWIAIGK